VWNDFAQFVVQVIAGTVMFVVVLSKLGGVGAAWTAWDELPPGNSQLFNEPYGFGFFLAFIFISFFSYNGGTWNLAQRYIAAPSGPEAKKAAYFSALLYLIWPLIMFFPMWMSPIFFPNLENPDQVYVKLTQEFLPAGLVGLVLAGLFAATMSMTSGDINAVSAVITRDILPVVSNKIRGMDQTASLRLARYTTLIFTLLTLIIGMNADAFGGVLGLVISWFGALIGPVSIPMLLGLLPAFKHSDSTAALSSIAAGLITFIAFKYGFTEASEAVEVSAPLLASLVVYIGMGWFNRHKPVPEDVEQLLSTLQDDSPSMDQPAVKA